MTKFIVCSYVDIKESQVLVNINNIDYIYNENGKPLITDKNKNRFYPYDEDIDINHFIGNFSLDIVSGK